MGNGASPGEHMADIGPREAFGMPVNTESRFRFQLCGHAVRASPVLRGLKATKWRSLESLILSTWIN